MTRQAPLRWVRVLDGEGDVHVAGEALVRVPNLEVITLASIGQIGPAASRNRALEFALPGWIGSIDSDDVLVPHGYARMIAAAEHGRTGFGASLIDDIDKTGEVILHGPDLIGGPLVPTGEFVRFRSQSKRWPWHASATVIRSELVKFCGGWATDPELSHSEDSALIARVNHTTWGRWLTDTSVLYRSNPDSPKADPEWERAAAMEFPHVVEYARTAPRWADGSPMTHRRDMDRVAG